MSIKRIVTLVMTVFIVIALGRCGHQKTVDEKKDRKPKIEKKGSKTYPHIPLKPGETIELTESSISSISWNWYPKGETEIRLIYPSGKGPLRKGDSYHRITPRITFTALTDVIGIEITNKSDAHIDYEVVVYYRASKYN